MVSRIAGADVEIVLLIVAVGTLIVALLTFTAAVTGWFKRTVPVECGFLRDDVLVGDLAVSTGDNAKPVVIRLRNKAKTTLAGLVVELRFLRPLSLSSTNHALALPPGTHAFGRVEDGSYYVIRHSDFDLAPEERLDYRVELDLTGVSPGTGRVPVTIYSVQQDYKYLKKELTLRIT